MRSLDMAALRLILMFINLGVVLANPTESFCLCPSLQDVLFTWHEKCMAADFGLHDTQRLNPPRVSELDVASLERVLNLPQKSAGGYTALLFHASWCPFSKTCRSLFDVLSSIFPNVYHVAVEESVVMPSVLSRYGVHSFPCLFLQNHTSRVRYQGSRELKSLVRFYKKITGFEPISLDLLAKEHKSNLKRVARKEDDKSGGHSPWEISPEKLLRQEPYLTFGVLFLILRMSLLLFPKVLSWVKWGWLMRAWHINLAILSENTPTFLEQTLHMLNVNRIWSSLKFSKTGNFQEGAINARVWASSLTSVSLGEGSSSRTASSSEAH